VTGEYRTIDPAELGPRELYTIMTSIIVPRPIAFVSSVSPEGVENLAPFSFYMGGGSNPPSLAFSPSLDREGEKDTLRNIEATGEFVVNTVDRPMVDGMNYSSRRLPAHESEWPGSGFSKRSSTAVKPPCVAESLAQFECRLFQIVRHGEGVGSARYVIGEIVALHVPLDLGSLDLVSRLGGADYLDLAANVRFTLPRP
jgi:flavin reductase (DIM6/NTAB) family NADH-FMN oxidoreductase RutF